MTTRARHRGFTLIEMVITLAIVALLAVSAMPLAELVAKREKEAQLRAALREIRTAIDAYKEAAQTGHIKRELGDSGFPPNLAALYEGVDDIASEKKAKLYFIRRIPRDPLFPDGAAPAEQTWGQRSYQSPPEQPQPGDDVFDVYSLSQDKGLNGVPYRDW
ncbi:MAG TPA: type II secretion system protein [Steroidobacteraceae bacterium]|jgi:general secretion pathway protein G